MKVKEIKDVIMVDEFQKADFYCEKDKVRNLENLTNELIEALEIVNKIPKDVFYENLAIVELVRNARYALNRVSRYNEGGE